MELEAFINKSYKNSLPVELVCQVKLWGATSSAYIVWRTWQVCIGMGYQTFSFLGWKLSANWLQKKLKIIAGVGGKGTTDCALYDTNEGAINKSESRQKQIEFKSHFGQ